MINTALLHKLRCTVPASELSPATLIATADQRLYQAKMQGRGQVLVYYEQRYQEQLA